MRVAGANRASGKTGDQSSEVTGWIEPLPQILGSPQIEKGRCASQRPFFEPEIMTNRA